MKTITLWQPWASLIAIGEKRIETRSWDTDYRGPLAIHAGQHWDGQMVRLCKTEPFAGVLGTAGLCERGPRGGWRTSLPFGAIVATCTLVGCYEIAGPYVDIYRRNYAAEHEYDFGDYTHGRYAWVLTDVVALPEPVPARGRQGLWDCDEVGLCQ